MNQNLLVGVDGVMAEALATGLFVSRCTIQSPDGLLGPSGSPSGVFVNVTGLTNIRCMDAPQPPSEIKLGAQSMRSMSQVTDSAPRHVLLDAFYPLLLDDEWRYGARAVIVTSRGGVTHTVTYEICGAEADSQQTQTRLELKLVTAGAVQA